LTQRPRLLKKISEARRVKIDEQRRTLQYVEAEAIEPNEAYEAFQQPAEDKT
jgi:hypothetical protein